MVHQRPSRYPLLAVGLALLLPLLLAIGAVSGRIAPVAAAGESGGFSPSFTLTGKVTSSATYDLTSLQALPSETVSVQYKSGGVLEQHTYRGVRLYDILVAARPQFDPTMKNDKLGYYLQVSAYDGYQAVIAWGEIDPDWEGKDILVAYEADEQPLGQGDGMARLVVPGDVNGGRFVSSIVSITLQRAGS